MLHTTQDCKDDCSPDGTHIEMREQYRRVYTHTRTQTQHDARLEQQKINARHYNLMPETCAASTDTKILNKAKQRVNISRPCRT
jgi:hypothetical protein